jgi:hypothetical protein
MCVVRIEFSPLKLAGPERFSGAILLSFNWSGKCRAGQVGE